MVAVTALVACAGPQKPAPPRIDPVVLARELHDEINQMAEIARRLRGSCGAMAGELRPLFARMQRSADTVHAVQRDPDPALAKQLVIASRAYTDRDRGIADRFADDLASCAADRDMEAVMSTMPTL